MTNKYLTGGTPSLGSSLLQSLESQFPVVGQFATTISGNQKFSTVPISNNRFALYTLVIRSPAAPHLPFATYTFPMSPQAITKSFTAMSNFYDVNGPASQTGVQRIIDQYGNSPVIYILEGTTGWKLHSQDGFALSGLQSIQGLEALLDLYATQNVIQGDTNQPPYTLEFYDYFKAEFWQVEPIGPQVIRQNAQRPQFSYYSFRLAAVKSLSDPIASLIDGLGQILNAPAQQLLGQLTQVVVNGLLNYVSQTPGAISLPGIGSISL